MHDSTQPMQRIFKQFLPTKLEFLIIILSNGILLLMVFYSLSVSKSQSVSEFQTFTELIIVGRLFVWVKEIAAVVISANVATMMLWGVIGSFVYSLINAFRFIFFDASSTFMTAFFYVHPDKYNKINFIVQTVLERLVSIIVVFIMVVYAWALSSIIIPFVFAGAKESIVPLSLKSFYSIGYFALFSLTLHGLVVLFRLESGRYKSN